MAPRSAPPVEQAVQQPLSSQENGAPLAAQGMTLREIRKVRGMTQVQVAMAGGMSRYRVAKIERENDVPIVELNSYIKAVGGKLHFIMDFCGQSPVALRVRGGKLVVDRQVRD